MKRITISVKEDTDLIFRKLASKKYRFKRGWYSESMAEAMKLWIEQELKLVKLDEIAYEMWEKVKESTNGQIDNCGDVIKSVESFFTENCIYASNAVYSFDEGSVNVTTNLKHPDEILKFVTNNDVGRTTIIGENESDDVEIFNSPFVLAIKAGIEEITNDTYKLDFIKYGKDGEAEFSLKILHDE
ncbi:MAG: hypothetical protein ACRCVG_01610 [Methanobacteriaceae archaeon]